MVRRKRYTAEECGFRPDILPEELLEVQRQLLEHDRSTRPGEKGSPRIHREIRHYWEGIFRSLTFTKPEYFVRRALMDIRDRFREDFEELGL